MKNPKPLTNSEGEVCELTEEDFQRGMNFSELPKNLQIKLKKTEANLSHSTHLQPIQHL
jgi:hypothetical protein